MHDDDDNEDTAPIPEADEEDSVCEKAQSPVEDKGNDKDKDSEELSPWGKAGIFTAIPISMLICTLVGFYVGSAIDDRVHSGGIIMAVFTLLGVAAGFKQVFDLAKKFD